MKKVKSGFLSHTNTQTHTQAMIHHKTSTHTVKTLTPDSLLFYFLHVVLFWVGHKSHAQNNTHTAFPRASCSTASTIKHFPITFLQLPLAKCY